MPASVFQNSLTRSAPLNSDSQGRFGNRFLSSYDHRFVIKTVSSEDIAEMHNILKKYHQVGGGASPSRLPSVTRQPRSCDAMQQISFLHNLLT